MTNLVSCKVLIVGAGPGGYVAAIRAGQLGLDTVIVEGDRAGGTCLIRGCIPSKALIHAASRFEEINAHTGDGKLGILVPQPAQLDMPKLIDWKDSIVARLSSGVEALLKKNKVKQIKGWANFSDAKNCTVDTAEGVVSIKAEHVILATGSTATELPFLPYSENVISSTQALDQNELPNHLVVIGAGYIGLEMGIAYRKLGAKVTFIEGMDSIVPLFDKELTKPVTTWLKKHNVDIEYSARAQSVVDHGTGEGATLTYTDKKGIEHSIHGDKILVTVGRRPNTQGYGLENMCVDMNGAFVKVDKQCRTAMKNVWAIGDLVGEPMLAHKASAQGEMVAEIISGLKREFNPTVIPAVCFTEPELVGVGITAAEAKLQGTETLVGKFPFAAIGKALAMEAGNDGGFVRITARKDNHVVIGIHAVGAHVAELSNQFATAIEMGARLEDLANTIHVHPTLGEATMEAAMSTLGHAIHM
ncbi:dihydrolipoyl dehydrogenase [Pseudocolwellia agarivorans]|uniref:dihydrolipoyl dehydrogenase n=1 Tax=Pseudocolwellia agarivorans TaxID=1911682 RepID=UPI00098693C4|nr:dihydrolipoyl dehydrogenase [Pseudocolwellia agarivorans]